MSCITVMSGVIWFPFAIFLINNMIIFCVDIKFFHVEKATAVKQRLSNLPQKVSGGSQSNLIIAH